VILAVGDPAASLGPGMSGLAAAGLVLFVLIGAAWLLKRGSLGLSGLRKKPLGFAVETAFSLGERRSLAVVSIEGRRLLLGLTPASISLISELPASGGFDAALDRHTASSNSDRPQAR